MDERRVSDTLGSGFFGNGFFSGGFGFGSGFGSVTSFRQRPFQRWPSLPQQPSLQLQPSPLPLLRFRSSPSVSLFVSGGWDGSFINITIQTIFETNSLRLQRALYQSVRYMNYYAVRTVETHNLVD